MILHRKKRTAVAATGIGFAVLVIFVQLGFYRAVANTALAVSSRFNADLVIVSPRFLHLGETGTIERARLFQSLALQSVRSALPVYFRYARWRDPETGTRCRLFAIAFPLADAEHTPALLLPEVTQQLSALRPGNTLLLDRETQAKCGPSRADGEVEVREQAARVVGRFEIGVGFLADGSLVTSDDTFSRLFGGYRLDRPHLGLVKLRAGADPDSAAAALRRTLPADVRVLAAAELEELQMRHWVENTAVGNVFGMGCIAGFFVGLVVLYEILSTDIRNALPLYATLQAMGYRNAQLGRFVLEQAWIFAALGYLPALGLSLLLFPAIHGATTLPIFVTPGLALFVLLLSFVMCSLAAVLSLGRLRRADPAELF